MGHVAIALVEEVAADIFMGQFSEKYLRAAQIAGRLLADSVYERYYDISYRELERIDDVVPSRFGPRTSEAFLKLCEARAGVAASQWRRSVPDNGTIIEQQQILTTQNLAVLVDGLGLLSEMRERGPELARQCFTWICQQQQVKYDDWRPRLHMIKNTAYAWRQMLFFLALAPRSAAVEFVEWAERHLAHQNPDVQQRFRPAVAGLALVVHGEPLSESSEARRFLGWTTGKHWLSVGADERG